MLTLLSRDEAQQKGLVHYMTGRPCKHGHIAPRFASNRECTECAALRPVTDQRKEAQRLAIRQRRLDPVFRAAENAKSAERMRNLYAPRYKSDPSHIARIRSNQKAYIDRLKRTNPQRLTDKYKSDHARELATVQGRLKARLRSRFHQLLRGKLKAGRSMEILGCDLAFFKSYIEERFTEGMSWDNFGQWHIDHIRPCASFDLANIDQQHQCFHYTNLQPLWAIENLKKGKKHV